jgi:hypothetical protein
MDIEGRNVLVLGGAGMVGSSVCRRLLELNPARLVVAARRELKARRAVERLQAEFPQAVTPILPVWGDVFLRSEWQRGGAPSRTVTPAELAGKLEQTLEDDADLRRRLLSIGIPVLLPDGQRLLRGPQIKSADAYHGWVDLTPANMTLWQQRLRAMGDTLQAELESDSSSRSERSFTASRKWRAEQGFFDIGEIAAWIMSYEERGRRGKE